MGLLKRFFGSSNPPARLAVVNPASNKAQLEGRAASMRIDGTQFALVNSFDAAIPVIQKDRRVVIRLGSSDYGKVTQDLYANEDMNAFDRLQDRSWCECLMLRIENRVRALFSSQA
jgi:hypothetical protein